MKKIKVVISGGGTFEHMLTLRAVELISRIATSLSTEACREERKVTLKGL